MNELDREIDQFKINLNEIDKLKKSLSENNEKINEIIKESSDIELIKKDIEKEIDKIKSSVNEYEKKQNVILILIVLSIIIGIISLINK